MIGARIAHKAGIRYARTMSAILVTPGKKIDWKKVPTAPPEDADKKDFAERAAKDEAALNDLQELMYAARTHALLIVLQGRDAAGKDGVVKHVYGTLNPRGLNVHSFGVPTEIEHLHDFLWRTHMVTPARGETAIFNRSYYEAVLVERVHELVPKKTWQARFEHINAFERMLRDEHTIVLKFYLNVSKDEQKKRLKAREDDPAKAYKLSPSDWKERRHWHAYSAAYHDAIHRCATRDAPWWIVPSDAKWYRNFCVAEVVAKTLRAYENEWREALGRRVEAQKHSG